MVRPITSDNAVLRATYERQVTEAIVRCQNALKTAEQANPAGHTAAENLHALKVQLANLKRQLERARRGVYDK